jgi:NTE family protein
MVLPNFLQKVKSAIDHEYKRTLYRNLVFKGGGVRGIAYMGALEVLDEYRIIENIERVAGTSAGAISAAMLSLRLSIPETRDLFNTLELPKIPQSITRPSHKLLPWNAEQQHAHRFLTRYGWYSSEYFYEWLLGVIEDHCAGNGRATFADFQRLGLRDLSIVAANLSRQRAEVFSVRTTPNVAVADAVRMSMSIPIYFEALQFDGQSFGSGDYYVDGGLFDNFPTHIFDKPELASRSWAFRDGINWETLGLFLYPDQYLHPDHPVNPDNVWEFLSLTLRNIYHSFESASYTSSSVDRHRSIEISDCDIDPTNFDIRVGDEKYNQLYQSGIDAVRKFFSPSP